MKSSKREDGKRGSRGRGGLLWMPAALLLFVLSAQAQSDVTLKPIGSPDGGGPFHARCPQGEVLAGFDLWTGDQVDAIRPICIPAVAGQFKPYPLRFGGNGGGTRKLVCPNDAPVVIAMEVASGGNFIVRNIHLFCGQAVATPQRTPFPLAVFDGPAYREECNVLGCRADGSQSGMLSCPTGLIGVGIVGRHGKFLDALGLICGAAPVILPPLVVATKPTVEAQGRVKLPEGTDKPPLSICEAARLARLRDSPAAPGLEAKCRASGTADIPIVPIESAALDFAGDWYSVVDGVVHAITLKQNGGSVTGAYKAGDGSAGKIAGEMIGTVFRFAWSQTDGFAGSGKFTLSGDGQSFKGSYNFGSNPDQVEGIWNGARQ